MSSLPPPNPDAPRPGSTPPPPPASTTPPPFGTPRAEDGPSADGPPADGSRTDGASAPRPPSGGGGGLGAPLIAGIVVVVLLVGAVVVQLVTREDGTADPAVADGQPAAGADAGPAGDTSPSGGQVGDGSGEAGTPDGQTADDQAAGGQAVDDQVADTPLDPAGEERSVYDLRVGDCYTSATDVGEVLTVRVVPCDTPHDDEVFHILTYPERAPGYPGQEPLLAYGNRECAGLPFASYVGVEYDESAYFTGVQAPSEASWADGDRDIVCVLYDPRGQMQQSAEGTAR